MEEDEETNGEKNEKIHTERNTDCEEKLYKGKVKERKKT
jgi:hypothetical protein